MHHLLLISLERLCRLFELLVEIIRDVLGALANLRDLRSPLSPAGLIRRFPLGLSRGQSECAADHLDNRLNDRELREFARFTNEIRDPETPREVFASLERISDRDIAAAVAAAGVRCALVR